MDEPGRDEEATRPRPKVIDKRVSARPAEAPEAAAPEPSREVPAGAGGAPTPPENLGRAAAGPPQAAGTSHVGGGGPPEDVAEAPEAAAPLWTPEQEAEAQRFAQEVRDTPSRDWVLNSAVTLANVAATKLDAGLAADAQLAIDGLAALVNELGLRLGDAEAPLRQTLAQLQMAYAQLSPPPRP